MGIFDGACPKPKGSENYGNRGTSWKPMIIISLACMAVTVGLSLSLIVLHLRRYRAPKEQRQIIRILFSVVVYSVVAFFELFDYRIAQYIDPIGDLYEAFGLAALFLLFIQYAAPSGTFDDESFAAVKAAEESETSFNWPKIAWVFVFQYPLVDFFILAVQEATEATGHYCLNSLKPEFSHLWLELIQSVSIGACVFSILKFRGHMKRLMKARRALSKIAIFKGIVFLRFTQQWVFSLLLQYHVMKPSKSYSYNDILYGIPSTATCAEMIIFSAAFWYAFSSTEYSSKAKPGQRPLPLWRAILHALNPWDLIVGMARIFPLCGDLRRAGDWSKWHAAQKEAGVGGAIRRGVRKHKAKKGQGDGRYQELDEGMEALTKPAGYHARSESQQSYGDPGYYPMSGGMSGQEMYQPPAGSPPDDARSYLMAESNAATGRPRSASQSYLMAEQPPAGRPRASSGSSLMVETHDLAGRPRSPSAGQWNGQTYDRPRSPSPGGRFTEAPMQGRDMV